MSEEKKETEENVDECRPVTKVEYLIELKRLFDMAKELDPKDAGRFISIDRKVETLNKIWLACTGQRV